MRTHAVGHGRADEIAQSGRRGLALCCEEHCEVSKRFRLVRTCAINPLRVSCGECPNNTIGCERLRHAAKQIEPNVTRRLGVTRDAPASEQRLDLRGKTESPTIIGGVKRLYPVR